jgi:4-alpha-glucanotransferase
VYTGTHDNDTLVGWLSAHERERDEQRAAQLRAERQRALDYAGSNGQEPHWDMIRTALMSVADTAIFPLQDLLGQGTEARMNVPGTADGNWVYRVAPHELRPEVAERMAGLCETYERIVAGARR